MQRFQRDIDDQGWETTTRDPQYVAHVTGNHNGARGPSWMNFLRCSEPNEAEQKSGLPGHKCGKGGALPCFFHSQPCWVRTASLFVQYNSRGMLSEDTSKAPWDATALLGCICMCSAFTAEEKHWAMQIRDNVRNEFAHQFLDMDYESAYSLMEGALVVFGGDVAGLQAHRQEARCAVLCAPVLTFVSLLTNSIALVLY